MLDRLGLPRPQLATKLYGAIALTLGVVYLLAAAAASFASRTEQAVVQFKGEGFHAVVLLGAVETALEQQQRLAVAACTAPDQATRDRQAHSYRDLAQETLSRLEQLGDARGRTLAKRMAALSQQATALLGAPGAGCRAPVLPALAQYAAAAEDLQRSVAAERQARTNAAVDLLTGIAETSRSLITWVCAAAAIGGLLIGPIALLSLRRVLSRLQGIGGALLRLARNDTSVNIPGLADGDEVGQLARSVAVFKSRSIELLQRKDESERLNLQLDAAINNMPLGLSMFDANERLLVCNRRYGEMYALPPELTRPGTPHCAFWAHRTKLGARHIQGGRTLDDTYVAQPHGGTMTIEFGKERTISVSLQPLKGGGWVSLHEDITVRCQQEQEIVHLARHDSLTGLANRALFREQLQQSLQRLKRGHAFALLCLDLDRFKSVNDTLGHPVGDLLLKHVSQRLGNCIRQGDLVARLGGDEFAIIQCNARGADQTQSLAERIVESISRPYEIEGQRIDISTSIGITLAPRDGADADELMKNADLALYRTKSGGRHGFSFFKPEMNDRIQVRRSFEVDLRNAFDNEELTLFYQPLVCLQTHRIKGFETLLRWKDPTRGSVPPAEFIAVAEEIGLINEIGAWTLAHACAQAVRWSAPVNVAVNLSPLQVREDLIEVVLQALAESGLPPERLELEITESVLLQDNRNTLAILHQLRQLGVRIAMDDFGTGYCSLSYLRSFPFDKIKIDRGFVSGVDCADESRAIVETVVALGKRLGMVTVAEGVESYGQLDVVRTLGCAEAQGYYFCPAVPAHEVERVLQERFEHTRNAA